MSKPKASPSILQDPPEFASEGGLGASDGAAGGDGPGGRFAPALRPLLVPIASLATDPENARVHPARNVDAIQKSLAKFGQLKPVVTHKGVIIAGNGTYQGAVALGWTEIAAVEAQGLTNAQARAYGIMDNKSGELAEWDFQKLSGLLRGLDMELLAVTGFEQFEIDPLLQADWTPPAPTEKGDGTETKSILFEATQEQAAVIRQAIAKVSPDGSLTDGEALEQIARASLADDS